MAEITMKSTKAEIMEAYKAAVEKLDTRDRMIDDPAKEAAKAKKVEVICRVDTSAYDQRVENRKKAEKLKKDMDAVIKQMDVTKKYEMYAAENPELAALLDQYKELTK